MTIDALAQIMGTRSITLEEGKAHQETLQDCMRICIQEKMCQGFEYYKSDKKCAWVAAGGPLIPSEGCKVDFYRFNPRFDE